MLYTLVSSASACVYQRKLLRNNLCLHAIIWLQTCQRVNCARLPFPKLIPNPKLKFQRRKPSWEQKKSYTLIHSISHSFHPMFEYDAWALTAFTIHLNKSTIQTKQWKGKENLHESIAWAWAHNAPSLHWQSAAFFSHSFSLVLSVSALSHKTTIPKENANDTFAKRHIAYRKETTKKEEIERRVGSSEKKVHGKCVWCSGKKMLENWKEERMVFLLGFLQF